MIIVDTGAFVALFDRKDVHHIAARQAFSQSQNLITTYPVITETCYMLCSKVGTEAQTKFLNALCQDAFGVFHLQQQHIKRMIELIEHYADSPMDMADTSLVILAEALGHGRILTVDFKDFYTYRWLDKNPFELLIKQQGKRS
jgi:uncharacterized protein